MKGQSLKNKRRSVNDPDLSPEDREEFAHGVQHFNNHMFHRSSEAWELLLERISSIDPVFLESLKDLTSACLSLGKDENTRGALIKFRKAYDGLKRFSPEYCYVTVDSLLRSIKECSKSVANGEARSAAVRFPQIEFHKPEDPDVSIELCEIFKSDQFQEGGKLFNRGLYWEAHETWEGLWREQNGEGKIFIEAFVQMADAYSFLQRGKMSSAIYLFEKFVKKLSEYEKMKCTLSVSTLVKELRSTLDFLRASPTTDGKTLRLFKTPTIPLPST